MGTNKCKHVKTYFENKENIKHHIYVCFVFSLTFSLHDQRLIDTIHHGIEITRSEIYKPIINFTGTRLDDIIKILFQALTYINI